LTVGLKFAGRRDHDTQAPTRVRGRGPPRRQCACGAQVAATIAPRSSRDDGAKPAFLACLGEAWEKAGWEVHAGCVRSNHFHLALAPPRENLVAGMQRLQSTFALRFNRYRRERGQLFQGRYQSLLVVPADALGPLCHYIPLNPVRAGITTVDRLGDWPWCSFRWLMRPKERAEWYRPQASLDHTGELADTPAGRRKYAEYLAWLAENAPEQKHLRFDHMSKDRVLGTKEFDFLPAGLRGSDSVSTRHPPLQPLPDPIPLKIQFLTSHRATDHSTDSQHRRKKRVRRRGHMAIAGNPAPAEPARAEEKTGAPLVRRARIMCCISSPTPVVCAAQTRPRITTTASSASQPQRRKPGLGDKAAWIAGGGRPDTNRLARPGPPETERRRSCRFAR